MVPDALRESAQIVSQWAQENRFVRRAWFFGSRVEGTPKQGSDLDIALEIDPVFPYHDALASWHCEYKQWEADLTLLLPFRAELFWYRDEYAHIPSPRDLIYEREDLARTEE